MASDAERILTVLRDRGQGLATAESLTGGRLAALVTAVPGASASYVGGVVAYATELKQSLLEVPAAVIERHGAVSAACATAMARGVQRLTGAHWALSTTGVAGPGSQEGHPPGTVYVGVVGPGADTALALELVGDRATVQARTCDEALSALADILRQEETPLG